MIPEAAIGRRLRVLFADDDFGTLVLGRRMLEAAGHLVDTAADGEQALLAFRKHAPDIVLLDLGMPRMDGIAACRAIKAECAGAFVPVIFITSAGDEDLVRCLEAGGDGFLSKPLNPLTLNAQLQAFRRIRDLHSTVQQQSRSLREHQDRLLLERQLASAVFERVLAGDHAGVDHLQHFIVPASRFAGDLILVAEAPCGGRHVLLADFTGHGLPAAIGTIPVSDVFHSATAAGMDLQSLLRELNQRIARMLPPGMFMAAVAAHVDPDAHTISVWNGGMPDGIVVRDGAGVVFRFRSRHPPLGVLGRAAFSDALERHSARRRDRLYLMTDGITEGGGAPECTYGETRLLELFTGDVPAASRFARIEADVRAFHATRPPHDDLAMVELLCEPAPAARRLPPLRHRVQVHVDAPALRAGRALQQLLQTVAAEPSLEPVAPDAAAVLCELFTNSLEHGLLHLDSGSKHDSATFEQYCRESDERTRRLEQGWIRIELELRTAPDLQRLALRVSDSGPGFDFDAVTARLPEVEQLAGRGLLIVRELATTLRYDAASNTVEAVLTWDGREAA